jgi:zinc transport system permease protein
MAGGFNVDLFSTLFGNILAVSDTEVVISVVLSLLVLLMIYLYYQDLFSITFDEEFARASGIRTGKINAMLVLLTGMTVVLAMNVVGIMLVSALLILPAVTALQLARGFAHAMLIAALTGVCAVVAGVFGSLMLNLPTGATIVMVNLLFFLTALGGKVFIAKCRSLK